MITCFIVFYDNCKQEDVLGQAINNVRYAAFANWADSDQSVHPYFQINELYIHVVKFFDGTLHFGFAVVLNMKLILT